MTGRGVPFLLPITLALVACAVITACHPARHGQAAGVDSSIALGPVLRQSGSTYRLVLPPAYLAAIERAVPGFVPWTIDCYAEDVRTMYDFTARQAPWAVVGDFDGDGGLDVVVEGTSRDTCIRICVWSAADGPRADILDSLMCRSPAHPGIRVLLYVKPGRAGTNFDDSEQFIPNDAYFDYFWEKAGSIWYWQAGTWHEFYAAD